MLQGVIVLVEGELDALVALPECYGHGERPHVHRHFLCSLCEHILGGVFLLILALQEVAIVEHQSIVFLFQRSAVEQGRDIIERLLENGGAPCVGAVLSYDVQIVGSACECHIEQVHVVNSGLQVLVLIVLGEVTLGHLLLAFHRYQRHLAERLLVGVAPQHVIASCLPVGEGQYDVVELQSLALVYGEQTDAVNLVAFDGFLVNVLVPLLQQGVDAWRIVVGKRACGIIEGADVSALVAQTVDSQYIIYIFYEVGQGHLCHAVESVDKLLGQQFVDAFLGGVAQH